MTKEELYVKGPFTAILTVASYLSGMFNEMLFILLLAMIADFLTGLIRAFLTKSVNSSIGLEGIMKKITMLIVVGLSGLVEFLMIHLGMDTKNLVVVTTICFFFVNEAISVLENSAQIGLPIPGFLYNALGKLKEFGGKEQQYKKKKKIVKGEK